MIRLSVVKDENGWSVRLGDRMESPFRRRDMAIREAQRIAASIRSHGEQVELLIEGESAKGRGKGGTMTEVVHLPAGAEPPQTERWVRIEQPQPGRFAVSISESRRRPLIKFEPHVDRFEEAVLLGRKHAERIGVETIHAIGCRDA